MTSSDLTLRKYRNFIFTL